MTNKGLANFKMNGKTALMFAVENGHLDITEFLLQKGANPNEKDSEGLTALRYVEYIPDEKETVKSEMLRLLKKYGASDVI